MILSYDRAAQRTSRTISGIRTPPEEDESSTITSGSITTVSTDPANADDAASERAAARAIDFIVSSKYFACGVADKGSDPAAGTQDCTSSSFLNSNILQLQCLSPEDEHRFRKMSLNKQHLCAHTRQFEQLGDMFIVQTDTTIR